MNTATETSMPNLNIWTAVRSRMPWAPRRPRITFAHLGLPAGDLNAVRHALQNVGHQLELVLELTDGSGQIILMEADLAARMSAQLQSSLADGRPIVLLSGPRGDNGLWLRDGTVAERHALELLQQLQELPLVRRRSRAAQHSQYAAGSSESTNEFDAYSEPMALDDHPDTVPSRPVEFDSAYDTELLASETLADAQTDLLHWVQRGLADPSTPPLTASYGVEANLRFDFRHRIVRVDPMAQRHLRVHRELPSPLPRAEPQEDATVRELDETVWDLGIASGSYALTAAPTNWWHTPLSSPPLGAIARLTRLPRHLSLSRELDLGPATPSQLRQRTRVDIDELRRFLQACLLLRLVQWLPETTNHTTLGGSL